MKQILIIAALTLASLQSFAGLSEKMDAIEKAGVACLDNPDNYSTIGMKECEGARYGSYDELLNIEYNKIVKNLKKKTGDSYTDDGNKVILGRLIEAERAWVIFRDSNTMLSGIGNFGGTLEGLEIISARANMVRDRILELDQLFNR